jgi:hypothetical protein
MNDPKEDKDFRAIADAWIHLTPLQKKLIAWRVMIESIRARAAQFIQAHFTRKE